MVAYTFIVTFYRKYSSLLRNNHGTIYQNSNMEKNVQIRHENNQKSNQEIGWQTKSKLMKKAFLNIETGIHRYWDADPHIRDTSVIYSSHS